MTENQRPNGHDDCKPTETPAKQPLPPKHKECDAYPPHVTIKEPDAPTPCPEDKGCKCPDGPTSTPNCLEDLIREQAAELAAAEKTKVFKADLEALLAKAKAANQEYTRDKYESLLKLWKDQDGQIAELVRKLACAVPCWKCLIECHICPFLNEMHIAEQRLYGDGTLTPNVKSLHDLLYWRTRDRD